MQGLLGLQEIIAWLVLRILDVNVCLHVSEETKDHSQYQVPVSSWGFNADSGSTWAVTQARGEQG